MYHPGTGLNAHSGASKFLQTCLDPHTYNTVPPSLFNQPTFSKNVSVSGNWVVADPTTEGPVKSSDGLVIWSTQYGGMTTVTRYGILQPGQHTAFNQILAPRAYFPNVSPAAYQPVAPFIFTNVNELCLPYRNNTSGGIAVSPDLGQDFSIVRCYAGRLMLISDSVPIGNTALTGRFSCGSISDIRDLIEINGRTFAETDLVQQSITKKDGLKGIRVNEGVVSLIGPDLNPNFSAPDPITVTNCGIADTQHLSHAVNLYTAPINPDNIALMWDNAVVFLTPYDISIQAVGLNNMPAQIARMNHLPLNGSITIAVSTPPCFYDNVPGTASDIAFEISAQHFFASLDELGRIIITVSDVSVASSTFNATLGVDVTTMWPGMTGTFNVSQTDTSQLYIGTSIIGSKRNLRSATTGRFSYSTSVINFAVTADSIYNSGLLGPTRVLRWDNVSPGQELKLDGVLLAQCVPEGQIAPFVTSSAQLSQVAFHLNVYPWLNALFNGPTMLSRNWRGDEYAAFCQRYLHQLGEEGIGALGRDVQELAEAGGLFGDLGGALGGMFGSRFGPTGALLGQALGGVGGAMADRLAGKYLGHSGGQFGDAAGQFGSAGGQFGSAGGQFGGDGYRPKRLRDM